MRIGYARVSTQEQELALQLGLEERKFHISRLKGRQIYTYPLASMFYSSMTGNSEVDISVRTSSANIHASSDSSANVVK